MIHHTILNFFEPHPYKSQIEYYGIRQFDLAKSIGISQPTLSKQLTGQSPMKQNVEDEIGVILASVKKKQNAQRIIKPILKRC
jgi:DNA transposition AAA+ family ATPase